MLVLKYSRPELIGVSKRCYELIVVMISGLIFSIYPEQFEAKLCG